MKLITWDVITGKKVHTTEYEPGIDIECELAKYERFNFMKKDSDPNMSGLYNRALLIMNKPAEEANDFEAMLTRYYDDVALKAKFENQVNYVKTTHDDKMFCKFRMIEIISPGVKV